ncbi:MAG: translation initiation factor IF-3 [Candidatus Zambryskibacteria bacterium RIFCSPHIGHO2_12_FULL_38_34]|uniref:Translation initiation factor IF-3 n=1 Tax=Candidatus Zambryskibacteria bacterium RIFCSPLOWO2_12_FULL_39_16 TaxID=1802775 RepID=A0A1G2UT77_9BACT|nr:MAG: translation initiation factor IF-3 [Candidatus Zambryskibacteria bacterium RIFCSPHIGHO2_02_FULL_38_22]OHA98240.1 MAG: translation initiation factor IF-3 [Candidatus Zambryskibacteria bacterium RIFCSPHIGHO2_12_FULL_38_34]OHB09087.1 MAG: translation initiation factor IF-3 [Candidatus Zambryskibacteria bacterium RIFCSPLOWO2_02_FULL_38_13]OHB12512.1 MAG: translation initiation factor IF-3 [Candidatus Zambryskibacteria bacterium RIFCSPLOWO2_12_FULL_39_16]
MATNHRVNNFIRAENLRLIGPQGENFGVVTTKEAISKALGFGLDLVEISPNAVPPIAKIVDYGKFLYSENKKQKIIKSKTRPVEVKSLQIKVGTSDHDLNLKAKKASEWLKEGHRVKINLFLPGRTKYMNETFLKERMERIFKLIPEDFKIAEEPKKSLKGLTSVIEHAK